MSSGQMLTLDGQVKTAPFSGAANGSVLDTESRDTPVCRGPLPNIAVGDLSAKQGPTVDTRI